MEFEYFHISDFDSPDVLGSGAVYMDVGFVSLLDEARKVAGIPFVISSGYRSPRHNRLVGGKPTSSHIKGLAADIKCTSSRQRQIIVSALLQVGITRIGVGKTFVHCDIDQEKAQHVMWLY